MMFMYKFNNNVLPPVFNNMFLKHDDVHIMYPTRQQGSFHIPVAMYVMTTRAIRFKGIALYLQISN